MAAIAFTLGNTAQARVHRDATAHRKVDLRATVRKLLNDPAVARAHWGISVVTLDGTPIFSRNEGQFFQPASNAKLFTTAAALALLNPQAHWLTQAVTSGSIEANGTLNGDVVLLGAGDPTLSGRTYPYNGKTERADDALQALEQMADAIVADGVRKIDGDVVGDDTWFVGERYGQGWSLDDMTWEYGAPVSALTINDNTVYLNVAAQSPGQFSGQTAPQSPTSQTGTTLTPRPATTQPPASVTLTGTEQISWNPPTPYYTLENETTLAPAGEPGHPGLDREPGSSTVRLYGSIGAGGFHPALAIIDPAQYAAQTFAALLRARSVQITGIARARHRLPADTGNFRAEVDQPLALHPLPATLLGPSANGRRVLASHLSTATLGEDVIVTNKVSQNLHAELFLRELGKLEANDGSFAQGARVVRQFLVSAGVDPGDFLFFDGSGLSTQDLVTPRAVTTLLIYAARQRWGSLYRESFPVSGTDGSLSGRFTEPELRGRIFAKTGTLAEVHALSGYMLAGSGRMLAFSIFCNDRTPGSEAARLAMDKIVAAISAAE